MRSWLMALPLGLALGLACGGSDEPGPPGVTISEDGSRIEVRDESGAEAVVAPDAGLPRGFPKDEVPLPDDATIVTYVMDDSTGGRGFTLHLEVDDAAQAAQQHRQKLRQAGFQLEEEEAAAGAGGSFETYRARSASWQVNVIAAHEVGSEKSMMMLNVTPPDAQASADGESEGSD